MNNAGADFNFKGFQIVRHSDGESKVLGVMGYRNFRFSVIDPATPGRILIPITSIESLSLEDAVRCLGLMIKHTNTQGASSLAGRTLLLNKQKDALHSLGDATALGNKETTQELKQDEKAQLKNIADKMRGVHPQGDETLFRLRETTQQAALRLNPLGTLRTQLTRTGPESEILPWYEQLFGSDGAEAVAEAEAEAEAEAVGEESDGETSSLSSAASQGSIDSIEEESDDDISAPLESDIESDDKSDVEEGNSAPLTQDALNRHNRSSESINPHSTSRVVESESNDDDSSGADELGSDEEQRDSKRPSENRLQSEDGGSAFLNLPLGEQHNEGQISAQNTTIGSSSSMQVVDLKTLRRDLTEKESKLRNIRGTIAGLEERIKMRKKWIDQKKQLIRNKEKLIGEKKDNDVQGKKKQIQELKQKIKEDQDYINETSEQINQLSAKKDQISVEIETLKENITANQTRKSK